MMEVPFIIDIVAIIGVFISLIAVAVSIGASKKTLENNTNELVDLKNKLQDERGDIRFPSWNNCKDMQESCHDAVCKKIDDIKSTIAGNEKIRKGYHDEYIEDRIKSVKVMAEVRTALVVLGESVKEHHRHE